MNTTRLLGWTSVIGLGLVALAPPAQAEYFARSHGTGHHSGHGGGPWWVGLLVVIVLAVAVWWYRRR